jgi:hypothetical protein
MSRQLIILLFLPILAFLITCDDDNDLPNGTAGPEYYALETEIARAPGEQYIYFITTDTVTPINTGIYRAHIANPIREKILAGTEFHSPVGAPNNHTVAYLQDSIIHYYSLISRTIKISILPDKFTSIVYVNDTLMVACRDTSLYLIDETDSTVNFFGYGWDPTYIGPNQFAYFVRESSLCLLKVSDIYEESVNILRTLPGSTVGRWPTVIPAMERVVYSIEKSDTSFIYSFQIGLTPTKIDTSLYSQACLADLDLILFTGPDGRIYQSDFAGNGLFPYIGFYDD